MKNPLTPAGIEPATFRFVAQHLNHCATAVPANLAVSPLKPGFISRKVRRPKSEADFLRTYNAEVKNVWSSNFNLHYVFPYPVIS